MADVYLYAADLWCESCGEALRRKLRAKAPADPSDESSYDSDDYPKGPYPDGGGESDSVHHCAAGAKCRERLKLGPGDYVGAFLENPLTATGAYYLRQSAAEAVDAGRADALALQVWAPHYCLRTECRDCERPLYPDDIKAERETCAGCRGRDVAEALREALAEESDRIRADAMAEPEAARRWALLDRLRRIREALAEADRVYPEGRTSAELAEDARLGMVADRGGTVPPQKH